MTAKFAFTKLAPLCAAIALVCAAPSYAASLTISKQTLDTIFGPEMTIGAGAINNLAIPTTTFYGNSLLPAAMLQPLAGNPIYDFADYYFLTVPAGIANGSTISIDLGAVLNIDNLHVNLFAGHATTLNPVALVSSVDTVAGPVNVSVLADTFLAAGNYTLQVLGDVVGSAGASYGGTLNLVPSPVPVPAAVWLLGSALTSVVVTGRRKAV